MEKRLVIASTLASLLISAASIAQGSESELSSDAEIVSAAEAEVQDRATGETEGAVTYESYGSDIGFLQTQPVPYNGDPFEDLNRAMLSFNDVADRYLLLPIVTAYKYITPDPIERSVDNIFANLDDVGSAAIVVWLGDVGFVDR